MKREVILDFNVYGNIKNGKNAVSEYIELKEETTSQEDELLTAMENTDAILYEIVDIEKERGIVLLKDVLNN